MTCVGLIIGAPVAYWGQRFAGSLIADLPAMSAFPVTFGAVTMIAIALVAAYVPAGRAARIDPMDALLTRVSAMARRLGRASSPRLQHRSR